MAAGYKIDQRQLLAELSVADPILKREADVVMKREFFDPAVETLKEEFEAHPVTEEIAGGIDASNISNTLEASFKEDGEKDSSPNLTSFIGFDEPPEQVLAPILQRLDPRHRDGPKLVYAGRDKDKLTYRYTVKGPDEEAIEASTGLPWADGISWVRRIEQGIPGISHFLNVKRGRSGGGVQVEGTLRQGRFKPTSYLSQILNNFLRRVAGLVDNGRRP